MKCERCGSDTRMHVQAAISAPGELAHQFSKQSLRRKDVHLMGVMWETADFICTNPKCGKVLDGYGNYVTNLKKEVERLKAKYEPDAPNAKPERLVRSHYQVWVESLNGVKGWAFSYPMDVMHAAACVKSKPTPIKESEAKRLASEFRDLGYRATVSAFDS